MDLSFFYITAKNKEEALSIGSTLVSERLAAGVNIIDGVHSIYHWEGTICNEAEAVLIVKTQKHLGNSLITRVKALHSYTCPCIVELPVLGGNPGFLQWIKDETDPR